MSIAVEAFGVVAILNVAIEHFLWQSDFKNIPRSIDRGFDAYIYTFYMIYVEPRWALQQAILHPQRLQCKINDL